MRCLSLYLLVQGTSSREDDYLPLRRRRLRINPVNSYAPRPPDQLATAQEELRAALIEREQQASEVKFNLRTMNEELLNLIEDIVPRRLTNLGKRHKPFYHYEAEPNIINTIPFPIDHMESVIAPLDPLAPLIEREPFPFGDTVASAFTRRSDELGGAEELSQSDAPSIIDSNDQLAIPERPPSIFRTPSLSPIQNTPTEPPRYTAATFVPLPTPVADTTPVQTVPAVTHDVKQPDTKDGPLLFSPTAVPNDALNETTTIEDTKPSLKDVVAESISPLSEIPPLERLDMPLSERFTSPISSIQPLPSLVLPTPETQSHLNLANNVSQLNAPVVDRPSFANRPPPMMAPTINTYPAWASPEMGQFINQPEQSFGRPTSYWPMLNPVNVQLIPHPPVVPPGLQPDDEIQISADGTINATGLPSGQLTPSFTDLIDATNFYSLIAPAYSLMSVAPVVEAPWLNMPYYPPPAHQLILDKPLLRVNNSTNGYAELIVERPQVRRTTIDDTSDLILESPAVRSFVKGDDVTGAVIADRMLKRPFVRDFSIDNHVIATHMQAPIQRESITLLPNGNGLFERQMERPVSIKIVLPLDGVTDTVLDKRETYELEKKDPSDPEYLSHLKLPYFRELTTPEHKHVFIEEPETVRIEAKGLKETWMEKPFMESLKLVSGDQTTWMEQPKVRETETLDISQIEPIEPMRFNDNLFRWGPATLPDDIQFNDGSLKPVMYSLQTAEVDEEFELDDMFLDGDVQVETSAFTLPLNGADKSCQGLSQFPVYYLNLQAQPNRRKYMEDTFGPSIMRVGATNGSNYHALLDKLNVPSPDDFLKDPWGYSKQYLNATPPEIGAMISHLDALKKAYQDGHDTVIILEDDVGVQLCPYWPADLSVYKQQADLHYPNWHNMQLQWTPIGDQASSIKSMWFKSLSSANASSMFDDNSYGPWADMTFPLVGKVSTLHGNAATMWSRRGLRNMLQKYQDPVVSRTRSGHPIRKWKLPSDAAATPDYILKQAQKDVTLFTAPPLFAQRFVDDVSSLSNDLQWRRQNLFGSIYSLQWYMELHELYRPGSRGLLPLKDFEFNIKE